MPSCSTGLAKTRWMKRVERYCLALSTAISSFRAVSALLSTGEDVGVIQLRGQTGSTSLTLAASRGRADMVRIMPQHGSLCCLNPVTSRGREKSLTSYIRYKNDRTALHEAGHGEHLSIIERLYQAGAILDAIDAGGKPPYTSCAAQASW